MAMACSHAHITMHTPLLHAALRRQRRRPSSPISILMMARVDRPRRAARARARRGRRRRRESACYVYAPELRQIAAIFIQTCNHFSPQYNSETAGLPLLATKFRMSLGIHLKNPPHTLALAMRRGGCGNFSV
eukprot:COSAG02_NODE_19167_length_896_cov_1.755332_1_plen_132_part_10